MGRLLAVVDAGVIILEAGVGLLAGVAVVAVLLISTLFVLYPLDGDSNRKSSPERHHAW